MNPKIPLKPPHLLIFFTFCINFRFCSILPESEGSLSSPPQTTLLFFTPPLLRTNSSTSAILQHNETAAKAFALAVRWTPSLHTKSLHTSSSTPGSLSHPSRSYQCSTCIPNPSSSSTMSLSTDFLYPFSTRLS